MAQPQLTSHLQLHWVIVMNAQGKTRLDKWFTPHGSVRSPPPRNNVIWNSLSIFIFAFIQSLISFFN
jgi:hypothetical protein